MKKELKYDPEQEQKLLDYITDVTHKLGSVNKFVPFHSGFAVMTMTDGTKYGIQIDRYISPEVTLD